MTTRSIINLTAGILTWGALLLAGCGGGSSGGGSSTPQPAGTTSGATTPPAATAATAPAKPTGVTAVGGTNLVTISWTPVSSATSYNIYWTNDPAHVMKEMGATKIANVTSPYRHTGLAAGTTYAYVVTTVNSAGESGESDTIASATTSAVDGVALYTSKCAGCHNPLNISEKKGRTAAQTQAAITANRGGMGSLSTLTAAQIQAIADVLGF